MIYTDKFSLFKDQTHFFYRIGSISLNLSAFARKKQKFGKLLHFFAEQLQFVVDFKAGHLPSKAFSHLDSNLLSKKIIYFIALIHDWELLLRAMS